MRVIGKIIYEMKNSNGYSESRVYIKHYDSVKEFRNAIKEITGNIIVARYSKCDIFEALREPVYIVGNAVDEYNYIRK